MSVGGVTIDWSKLDILASIKEHDGKIKNMCIKLKVSRQSLTDKIAESVELTEELAKARHRWEEVLLDKAEASLEYAVDHNEKNISAALKSAFYTLNNKGKKRGYAHAEERQAEAMKKTPEELQAWVEFMNKGSDEHPKKPT